MRPGPGKAAPGVRNGTQETGQEISYFISGSNLREQHPLSTHLVHDVATSFSQPPVGKLDAARVENRDTCTLHVIQGVLAR